MFILFENQTIFEYDYDMMQYKYYIDKTPMNFYLPHAALIFGYYFSYKNIIQHVRGLKVLTILRDPYKRYRSWFGQNSARLKYQYRNDSKLFKIKFNESVKAEVDNILSDKHMILFHKMIKNRQNEYDDTQIMLLWFKWYYGKMRYKLHKPMHGFFASLYYPQLLLYIHFYKQLGLIDGDRRMFKVITFDFVILNGEIALHLINCWVRFALDDMDACLNIKPITDSTGGTNHGLKKLNAKAVPWPNVARQRLIEYFVPIKQQTERLLRQYPNVILGQFEGFKSIVH